MVKVLIVSNDPVKLEIVDNFLSKKPILGILLVAKELSKASELIKNNPDIKVVLLDAYVPGDGLPPNTSSLIPSLEKMKVKTLAISDNEQCNNQLVQLGVQFRCDKNENLKVSTQMILNMAKNS